MSRLAFSALIGALLFGWFLAPGFDFRWGDPEPVPGCPVAACVAPPTVAPSPSPAVAP